MNKIISKVQLSKDVFLLEVEAPYIAKERKAGQFIILQLGDDYDERIPLTIADADEEKGTICLLFQAVGATTFKLSLLEPGDYIPNLLGPLGHPTDVRKYGKVVLVGGGIGVAPTYPIAKAMKAAGNEVRIITGARTKDLLIFQDRMHSIDPDMIVITDDGTAGRKGLVTEPLKELCEEWKPDLVVAIGPTIMMKFCALTTKPYNIKTLVSLNTIMIDGTGMCGGCRVSIGGEMKFVCVEGPEFDGHQVDWDNMMMRQKIYKEREGAVNHKCRIRYTKEERGEV